MWTIKSKAIKSLQNYKSIVIKPSDKSGGVVVMNTQDYEKACLQHLSNTDFYAQLDANPNDEFRKSMDKHIHTLRSEGLITDVEEHNMLKGKRTP